MRRQDLPANAIMSLTELRQVRDANTSKQYLAKSDINEWRLPIAAISYCWLDPSDPDPRGDQLRSIGAALERALSAQSKIDVKGAAQADWGKAEMSVFSDVGVFIDYFSMDQQERTESEAQRFKKALHAVNLWYNHPYTTVFLLMDQPDWYVADTTNRAYSERGWPIFEKAIATMNKKSSPLWWDALVRLQPTGERLIEPALTPAAFQLMISDTSKISFTNGADVAVVNKLYDSSLKTSLSTTERLAYSNLGWADAQISTLTELLVPPLCCNVVKCHLDGNAITDVGVAALCALARRSGVLPSLTHLFLDKNRITDAGAEELWACLGEMVVGEMVVSQPKNLPKLLNLYLSENDIGTEVCSKLSGLVTSGRLRKCVV